MAVLTPAQKILQFDVFQGFTQDEVQMIFESSVIRKLEPGEILIEPGRPNHTLFLIMEGKLQIVIENNGTQYKFHIKKGEYLGEMSLVMGRSTSALVLTLENSEILCIPEKVFWDRIMMTRKGVRNLMSLMAARLRRTNEALIEGVEEQLKYKHLQRELETAGKIQTNLVPDGKLLLPKTKELDVHAHISQARDVGGDFYDAMLVDDRYVYFTIGDVSGKGMPAALFMVRAFTFLRLLISNKTPFEDIIPSLNAWLAAKNEDMMFISIFTGVLDLKSGLLRYINAGHNPPFISTSGKAFQLLESANGPVVGILDKAQFSIDEITLEKGDSLILYTDGIPEATNAGQEMYETDRMEEVLNKEEYESMEVLLEKLLNSVNEFVAEAPQHDDFTTFALKFLGTLDNITPGDQSP